MTESDDWIVGAADKVFRTVGGNARQEIGDDREGRNVLELVKQAQHFTDSIIQQVLDLGPSNRRPACREGCAACCHLHVVSTPIEVIGIAKFLRQHMFPERLTHFLGRIDHHIKLTAGLDALTRQQDRSACPFLESGRCEIYSIRPVSCRGWNSLNRAICDADLDNPTSNAATPVNLGQYVVAGRVAEGLAAASDSHGLESHLLDFVRGLRIALDDPDGVAIAWRIGTCSFAEAENDAVFCGPRNLEQEQARRQLWNSL